MSGTESIASHMVLKCEMCPVSQTYSVLTITGILQDDKSRAALRELNTSTISM